MATRSTLFGALGLALAFAVASPGADAGTIGIVIFQGSSETQARVLSAAQAAAEKAGHRVIAHDARGSLVRYRSWLEDLVERRVDGIVIGMGKPDDTNDTLERARQQGIYLASVTTGSSPHVHVALDANHYVTGVTSGMKLFDYVSGEGDIASIRYEKNFGSRARGRTFDAVLAETPRVREVARHTMTNTQAWQSDVAAGVQSIVDTWGTTLKGFWVSFDGQALVVDDVLRARGIDRIRTAIVTVDGSQAVYRRIADSKSSIVATVALPFETMATDAVTQLSGFIDGTIAPPQGTATTLYDGVLVDESNVANFLES